MGTPAFAETTLKALINHGFNIVGVITVPDKPAGRGLNIQMSAVKQTAIKYNLPILQPEKLKDEAFLNQLQSLKADIQVVVAFRMLPEVVWNMPPLGTYNIHASLLPKYRGAAPINHAIINGEKETGVTTFKLKHEIDTGSIALQEKVLINDDDNAGVVHDKLMNVGAELIIKTLDKILNNSLQLIPQTDENLTHAPKITKEFCRINWQQPTDKVFNFIRGLSPYPGAYFYFLKDNKPLYCKILECTKEQGTISIEKIGEIKTDEKHYLKISTLNGYINIIKLQIEGKKAMTVEEFLRGFRFNNDIKILNNV